MDVSFRCGVPHLNNHLRYRSVTKLTDEEKHHAIDGEFMLAMVAAGVDRVQLGKLMKNFSQKVAEILELSPAPKEEAPDIHAVVTHAVESALDSRLSKPQKAEKSVRVTVVTAAGKRTTVTLPEVLMNRVDSVTGSREQTCSIIKDIGSSAPIELQNRSLWISERLQAFCLEGLQQHAPRH